MVIIGLDLHKRERQRARTAADGTITEQRIATSRERFAAVLGGRPRARMLLEASTEKVRLIGSGSGGCAVESTAVTRAGPLRDTSRFWSALRRCGDG